MLGRYPNTSELVSNVPVCPSLRRVDRQRIWAGKLRRLVRGLGCGSGDAAGMKDLDYRLGRQKSGGQLLQTRGEVAESLARSHHHIRSTTGRSVVHVT